MKRKHKLSTMVLKWQLIIGVALIIVTCLNVGFQYVREYNEQIRQQAFGYARSAAQYIDGDRITLYAQTLKKDDYYKKIQEYFNTAQRETNLKYYYVSIPTEDGLIYIWDANNIEGSCELGEKEAYMKGGKEAAFRAFQKNPEEKLYYAHYDVQGYLASAYYPIFNSKGEPVAIAGADLSMSGIRSTLLRFLLSVIISVIFVIAIFMVVLYLVFKKQVVQPIENLRRGIQHYHMDMDAVVAAKELKNIPQKNEIGDLSRDFVSMMTEIKRKTAEVIKLSTEKERIGAELELARNIQANMLPNIFPPFPERTEFDIFASMTPAKEVGGDFYDFFLIDDDHLGIAIADVSGKGVPAALFMMVSKILVNNYAAMESSPAKVLEQVNTQICKHNQEDMFVTVWFGVLEISTGKVTAANAGHEYPIIKKAHGEFELLKDKHGFVVGGMESTHYTEYEFTLEKGGTLFLYTDGVAEATNADNELFGTSRLLDVLNRNRKAPPKELLTNTKMAVDKFVGSAPQFDDLTMLAIKLL